ncbi:MAG: RDD family protein [Myxococcales bacterium]|nr:RDD family protein [Myxococcales bacterium]
MGGPAPQKEPRTVEIICPEAIPLRFELGSITARTMAFFFDFFLLTFSGVIAIVGMVLLGILSGMLGPLGLGIVIFFILRQFYFALFETLWHGTTPGKRLLGLRVISKDGSSLGVDAVLTRNLMRDVELFLPLGIIAAPEQLFGDVPGWIVLPAIGWMLVIFALPLLNRERMRAGDLAAGTLVVFLPKPRLLFDEAARTSYAPADGSPGLVFSPRQLSFYGEHELETLADLIRKIDEGKVEFADQTIIASTIAKKIGFEGLEPWQMPTLFLRAFYKQQRAELEKALLFGKRKANKWE